MAFVIVTGSTRADSQSRAVGEYLRSAFLKANPAAELRVLDLAEAEIPLWDESQWSKGDAWSPAWNEAAETLVWADGLITVTPEWHGMVPPALKNLYLLCTPDHIGHKPNLLVGVSASQGGSYPITELRASAYKNNKVCFLPEQLIFRQVKETLAGLEAGDEAHALFKARIDMTLNLLHQYALALKPVRDEQQFFDKAIQYGM